LTKVRPIGEVTESGRYKIHPAAMTEKRAAQLAERILSMYFSLDAEIRFNLRSRLRELTDE